MQKVNLIVHGQVYAWGSGSCLGCGQSGVAEFTALRPRLVEDLQNVRIVDISCGDSHCLALSHGMLAFLFYQHLDGVLLSVDFFHLCQSSVLLLVSCLAETSTYESD